MTRTLLACWALGVLAVASPPALPQPPVQLLPETDVGLTPEAIFKAQQDLPFAGEMQIGQGRQLRLLQGVDGQQRLEVLDAKGETRDLVVVDGERRWHAMPDRQAVMVQPVEPPTDLAARVALVRKNYRFQVLGQARQAGRMVLLTRFSPLYHGNPIYMLSVDLVTRLPLVVERRGQDGGLLDRVAYTRIDYAPRLERDVFHYNVPPGTKVSSPLVVLAQGAAEEPLPRGLALEPDPPTELPDGYVLQSWRYFRDAADVPTFHWRYHDGLGTLSLFATTREQAPPAPPEGRPIALGQREALLVERDTGRLLTWSTPTITYTLVGELPAEELLAMARSTP